MVCQLTDTPALQTNCSVMMRWVPKRDWWGRDGGGGRIMEKKHLQQIPPSRGVMVAIPKLLEIIFRLGQNPHGILYY